MKIIFLPFSKIFWLILQIIFSCVKLKSKRNNNKIHFINCGNSDAILIQGNEHFGLIDSSFPIQKNKSNNLDIKEYNVKIILKYLKKLKVNKLDFIIGTHSHIDHLGGIPSISKKYVNKNTKYFYKEYKEYKNINIKKYYTIAINSMKEKNAKLIDVTNRIINFNLGEMNIELLNTFVDKNLNSDDNQNSILTLIKFKNIKLLLPGDMTKINVKKLKNCLRNINILKLPHHGKGDISKKILNYMKPSFIIISTNIIYPAGLKLINYMKNKYGTQILVTKNIKDLAIILNFKNDSKNYFFFKNFNNSNSKFTNKNNIIIIQNFILLFKFENYI